MKKEGRICDLNHTNEGVVFDILDHDLRSRLVELGFQKGKEIVVLRKAAWSESVIVLVAGRVFGLRKEEAAQILLAS